MPTQSGHNISIGVGDQVPLQFFALHKAPRARTFKIMKHSEMPVRFFLPLEPKNPDNAVWSAIRMLPDKPWVEESTPCLPTSTMHSKTICSSMAQFKSQLEQQLPRRL